MLEPAEAGVKVDFTPGDYLQLDIPAYETIQFRDFDVPEPFATVWRNQHVFDLVARNPESGRRNNYSLASNRHSESVLRFNVRIATPPPGQDCAPGVGSSYIFSLKSGDHGDRHRAVRRLPHQADAARDGLYRRRGGHGAAARPSLPPAGDGAHRAQDQLLVRRALDAGAFLSGLLRGAGESRIPISSSTSPCPLAQPEDRWSGHVGFIHDVARETYLRDHPAPADRRILPLRPADDDQGLHADAGRAWRAIA